MVFSLKLNTTTILILILVAAVIIFGWVYLTPGSHYEGMTDMEQGLGDSDHSDTNISQIGPIDPDSVTGDGDDDSDDANNVQCPSPGTPSPIDSEEFSNPTASFQASNCYPGNTVTADELLPKGATEFSQMYPTGQGSMADKNFLTASFSTGIDTIGQTLRNPNLGLRSEPPNPQVVVSPWMQTSMQPDVTRRGFELGGCS